MHFVQKKQCVCIHNEWIYRYVMLIEWKSMRFFKNPSIKKRQTNCRLNFTKFLLTRLRLLYKRMHGRQFVDFSTWICRRREGGDFSQHHDDGQKECSKLQPKLLLNKDTEEWPTKHWEVLPPKISKIQIPQPFGIFLVYYFFLTILQKVI